MLYRGCTVPPEDLKPGFNGYTVLKEIEHRDMGKTFDVISSVDGEEVMMATACELATRLQKRLRKTAPEHRIPYSERLMSRGFCQRPLVTTEVTGVMHRFSERDAIRTPADLLRGLPIGG